MKYYYLFIVLNPHKYQQASKLSLSLYMYIYIYIYIFERLISTAQISNDERTQFLPEQRMSHLTRLFLIKRVLRCINILSIYLSVYLFIYICMHTCVYVCTYVHIAFFDVLILCICIYIYIYIYKIKTSKSTIFSFVKVLTQTYLVKFLLSWTLVCAY